MFGICSSKYVAASSHIFIPFYTGWLIGIPLMDYDNPKYIGWSLQSSIYQQGCLAATALILVYSYVPHHTISWLNIPISHSAIILLSHYITVYYPMKYPLQSAMFLLTLTVMAFLSSRGHVIQLVEHTVDDLRRHACEKWWSEAVSYTCTYDICMYVRISIYIYTLYIHITIISYYHILSCILRYHSINSIIITIILRT